MRRHHNFIRRAYYRKDPEGVGVKIYIADIEYDEFEKIFLVNYEASDPDYTEEKMKFNTVEEIKKFFAKNNKTLANFT